LYNAECLNADVDLCPSSLIDYQAEEIRIVYPEYAMLFTEKHIS